MASRRTVLPSWLQAALAPTTPRAPVADVPVAEPLVAEPGDHSVYVPIPQVFVRRWQNEKDTLAIDMRKDQ